MKKIFTTLLCIAAFACANAAVTVTQNGTPLENGAVITFTKEDFKKPAPVPGVPWTADTHITISAASAVGATVVSNSDAPQFCPTGDVCYVLNPDGDLFKASGTISALPNDVHIAMTTKEAEVPAFNYYMDITLAEAEGTPFKLRVVFNTTGSGVDNAVAASDIRYEGGILTYSLGTAAPLEVYAITGAKVLAKAPALQGQADLNALAPGVYICRIATRTIRVLVK